MTSQIVTVYVILAILILAVSGFFAFLGYRIWHNNPIEAFKPYFRVNEDRFYPERQLRFRAGFYYMLSFYLLIIQVCNLLNAPSKYSIAIHVLFMFALLIYGIAGYNWTKKK